MDLRPCASAGDRGSPPYSKEFDLWRTAVPESGVHIGRNERHPCLLVKPLYARSDV